MGWARYFRRQRWDEERSREIEAYLEMETADNLARGMSPAEASAAARRKFGNPTLIREEIHRMNSLNWLESVWQDLRYGARLLRLSPGFTLVAVVSLALGIGANTAIFELVNAVRLRNLPVPRPQELARVTIRGGNVGMGLGGDIHGNISRPMWEETRRRQQAFSSLFAWTQNDVKIGRPNELRRASRILVSGDFFPALDVPAWRGRLLLPEDEAAACPANRLVVSHAFWQAQMGGRELDVASKLIVDGQLHDVIGVVPPTFTGMEVGRTFDLAIPFCQGRTPPRTDVFDLYAMGRLRPGWTLDQATAHLEGLSEGVMAETEIQGYDSAIVRRYRKFRLMASPGSRGISWVRTDYGTSLWLLLGITGLVLLIACANLANLMLARSSAREREIGVRLALGASRGRLLRQMMAESLLLTAIGTGLGLALAHVLSRILVTSLSTQTNPIYLPMELDWRVLLFATSAAALTSLIFGALPASRVTRMAPEAAMRSSGRGMTTGRERFSLQRTMVVTQIAVSLTLLVGALLFVRSFLNLMTLDTGIRQRGMVVAMVSMPGKTPPEQAEGYRRSLLDTVGAVPGIRHVSSTSNLPLSGSIWSFIVKVDSKGSDARFTFVSPSYFESVGIPLLAGRPFDATDGKASKPVAIVNQTFARRFFGARNPLGRTLRTIAEPGFPSVIYEIVGVIPNTKYSALREETPAMVFVPELQDPGLGTWATLMIHSDLPYATVTASVKQSLTQKFPLMQMEFMDFPARVQDSMVRERVMAILSGFFDGLAGILAMIGLYGVVSYLVARRKNEIGIRMALGAHRRQVVKMVMLDAGRLIVAGIVVGAALSVAAARSTSTLLFGLSPYDTPTMLIAAALLAAITAGASFIPARRAAALDPMAALRHE